MIGLPLRPSVVIFSPREDFALMLYCKILRVHMARWDQLQKHGHSMPSFLRDFCARSCLTTRMTSTAIKPELYSVPLLSFVYSFSLLMQYFLLLG